MKRILEVGNINETGEGGKEMKLDGVSEPAKKFSTRRTQVADLPLGRRGRGKVRGRGW